MIAQEVRAVAVVGAGTMGAGIAQTFAQAGIVTRLVDVQQSALDSCIRQVAANLRLFAEFGLLGESATAILGRISRFSSQELAAATEGVDFVVESVPEKLAAKRELFAALDQLPGHVVLASNTSSFTVSQITNGMQTAHRAVGLHYFNPAHIIPAVEVHRGPDTSETTVEAARSLMVATGKVPVLVRKEIAGFIINRLTGAIEREVDHLLDEGVVSPEDLDVAVTASLGFRLACMGPMEAEDMIGLDVAAAVSANLFKQLSNATEPSPSVLDKVSRGELGVKAGRGWYDYTGRSREEVLDERNRRLLKLLVARRDGHRGTHHEGDQP